MTKGNHKASTSENENFRLAMTGPAEQRMTVAERVELGKIVRARTKVAKNDIAAQAAKQLADMERQLAAQYDFSDEAWKEITAAAAKAVKAADAEVAKRCRAMGIPETFRPQLSVSWYRRGENAVKERRSELRAMAEAEIEAREKAAKVQLDRIEADLLTEITANGLTSENARTFLVEKMPSIESLMPKLSLAKLEKQQPLLGEGPAIDEDYKG